MRRMGLSIGLKADKAAEYKRLHAAVWPGVLATIAAGLFVSWKGPLLIPAATRLQGIFFWDFLVYLLEGFVFLVTGLQARTLLDRLDAVQLRELGLAVLLTVAVVIAARYIWVYPATYLPRWLSPSLARRDPSPPWQWVFLLAFVGVRGVVSLAAALAIPLTTAAGAPFPDRAAVWCSSSRPRRAVPGHDEHRHHHPRRLHRRLG